MGIENREHPAVISASIGGYGKSNFMKVGIERTIKDGITVIVSAGNENDNSCDYTPGYVPSVINVGATSSDDKRAGFSQYGKCIDIFAPGVNIKSAGHKSDRAIQIMHGTSMACPHVSGAAALLLQKEPDLSPKTITERLLSSATKDKVKNALGSPNKLLYIGGSPTAPSPPTECKDTHRKCSSQSWKKKRHKSRIAKLCPKMCGKCSA